jgi:hypothetical protein
VAAKNSRPQMIHRTYPVRGGSEGVGTGARLR